MVVTTFMFFITFMGDTGVQLHANNIQNVFLQINRIFSYFYCIAGESFTKLSYRRVKAENVMTQCLSWTSAPEITTVQFLVQLLLTHGIYCVFYKNYLDFPSNTGYNFALDIRKLIRFPLTWLNKWRPRPLSGDEKEILKSKSLKVITFNP